TLRMPFLNDLLAEAGEVTRYEQHGKALNAVKRGLGVDVAVIHYRLALTPLIQAIRSYAPRAKILAYGSPRRDTPLGVDRYLSQPILSAELASIVDEMAAKPRAARANGEA
ncbi:MAG: hypothetical protein ACRDOE_13085, partial [Streptosporangiaceae bacterium]